MKSGELLAEIDNYYLSWETHKKVFEKVGFKKLEAVTWFLSDEVPEKDRSFWKDCIEFSPICALIATK